MYSFETLYEIWDDKDGTCIQVGPDRDGLDMVEIRERTSGGQVTNRITCTLEQARMIAKALNLLVVPGPWYAVEAV